MADKFSDIRDPEVRRAELEKKLEELWHGGAPEWRREICEAVRQFIGELNDFKYATADLLAGKGSLEAVPPIMLGNFWLKRPDLYCKALDTVFAPIGEEELDVNEVRQILEFYFLKASPQDFWIVALAYRQSIIYYLLYLVEHGEERFDEASLGDSFSLEMNHWKTTLNKHVDEVEAKPHGHRPTNYYRIARRILRRFRYETILKVTKLLKDIHLLHYNYEILLQILEDENPEMPEIWRKRKLDQDILELAAALDSKHPAYQELIADFLAKQSALVRRTALAPLMEPQMGSLHYPQDEED